MTRWLVFGIAVAVLLAIDLLAHRGGHAQSTRSASIWTAVWIASGLAFGVGIWFCDGASQGQDYFAAYLIEKSLSVDNLFVFLLIFQTLNIAPERQHSLLFWGVLGALVLRAFFVWAGVAALERWDWVGYAFGALLLFAAFRSSRSKPDQEENALVRWLASRFGTRHTPAFVAVLGLELTDIMFAIDSVPAALSVTHHTFIVYSSNVFAILGLRSLYLVLARALGELDHLHYGIAAVLAFTGLKMILHHWIAIPSWLSIAIIAIVIAISVLTSLRKRRKDDQSSAASASASARYSSSRL